LSYTIYFLTVTFSTPHDCFECFNRLPNKRYSIYQFTQDERNRQRDRQYGKGAIERFESLLREDEAFHAKRLETKSIKAIRPSDGRTESEAKVAYEKYKSDMMNALKAQDKQKREQEAFIKAHQAFDQREILINSADVLDIMGS
jgi:hypothetical protein